MKFPYKLLSLFALLAVLAFSLAAPAQAFDGRTGEEVSIPAGETVDDDLYVNAAVFTLDGTVKGDLIVFGSIISINGTVEGDLIAAGQSVVINGKIGDDARIAGGVLQVGKDASIGGDLVAAGGGLELMNGSAVGGDLAVGAGQALLAGDIAQDVLAGCGSLEIRGNIGGNVKAEVGDPEQDGGGPPMSIFFPNSPASMPSVLPGFNISPDAKINGNLEYTQSKDIKIPAGVVGGNVKRVEPVVNPNEAAPKPTPAEAALKWTLDLLRSIVSLLLVGLLLGWLTPAFLQSLISKIQEKPLAAFGWGVVAYAAFFFALLVALVAMIVGATLFGALTLSKLTGAVVWVGIFVLFALILFFVLAVVFVTKIAAAQLGGQWLLRKFNSPLAENKYLPLVLGVVLLAILMALPYFGWLFSLLAVLAGLGALWMRGGELLRPNPALSSSENFAKIE